MIRVVVVVVCVCVWLLYWGAVAPVGGRRRSKRGRVRIFEEAMLRDSYVRSVPVLIRCAGNFGDIFAHF